MLETFLVAAFTLAALALTIGFFRSLSLIPALHATTVILKTTAFQAVSLVVAPRHYQTDVLLLLLGLLSLYVFLTLFFAPVFKNLTGDTHEFLRTVLDMSPRGLWSIMAAGLA